MDKRRKVQIGKILLLLVAFGIWAGLIFGGALEGFDISVQKAFLSIRNPWLTTIMAPLEYVGHWPIPTVICVLLLLYPKTRFSYGIPLSGATLSAVGAYSGLKHLFCRMRPDVSLWLVKEHGYSFPSGHSLNNLVFWLSFAGLMAYYYKHDGRSLPIYKMHPQEALIYPKKKATILALRYVMIFWVILIGFSRIYLAVHWPSDVIGGWIMGFTIIEIAHFILFYRDME